MPERIRDPRLVALRNLSRDVKAVLSAYEETREVKDGKYILPTKGDAVDRLKARITIAQGQVTALDVA